MRLMAEDRGIQIETRGLAAIVIRGDRARLKQVIVNLLDNAIKFTPRGGTVTLRARQSSPHSILEVRDTGIRGRTAAPMELLARTAPSAGARQVRAAL
jgi:signal transduction histidine kinase